MTKAVFWDFHGTLTYDKYGWSGTMLRILNEYRPGHAVRRETISRLLCSGFPWHTPQEGHTAYNDDPEGWWRASDKQMARVYNQVGVPAKEAARLSGLFRETYIECAENFIPYPDVTEALTAIRERGYMNVILSNHIPELDEIVAQLSFSYLIDGIVSSAVVGYEKPHPAIFAHARRMAGEPDICWMVGDNYKADYLGAIDAGFNAIWVHGHDGMSGGEERPLETLMAVVEIIDGSAADG